MKYCTYCGSEVSDEKRYCEKCCCVSFTDEPLAEPEQPDRAAASSFEPKRYDIDVTGESASFIVNKLQKNKLKKLNISLVAILVVVAAIVGFAIVKLNEDKPEPADFIPTVTTTLTYSKITVYELVPYAENDDGEVLAFCDIQGYAGLVKISKKHSDYDKLIKGSGTPVTLIGLPQKLSEEIIEFMIEDFEDINSKADAYNAIGEYYFDTTSSHEEDVIVIAVFLISLIVMMYVVIAYSVYPKNAVKSVKRLIKTNSVEYANDVLNGFVEVDPVSRLAFTDKFLYDEKTGAILRYEDIAWAYKKVTTHSVYYVIKVGETEEVIIATKDNKRYSFPLRNWKRAGMHDSYGRHIESAIFSDVQRHCPDALIGYSENNKSLYKIKVRQEKLSM